MNQDRNSHQPGLRSGFGRGFHDVPMPARTDGIAEALRRAYSPGGESGAGAEISRLLAELDKRTNAPSL